MSFLIGAYGLFWQRSEVSWDRHRPWQLLGHRTTDDGAPAVCDFTTAPGFYVLYDDYSANYVGLARGKQGIGPRLVDHHRKKIDGLDDWSRFSWFSIAPVHAVRRLPGWYESEPRDELNLTPELAVKEFEAPLIQLLGSRRQRQMRFQNADRWHQLTQNEAWTNPALGGLDTSPVRDWILKEIFTQVREERR